MAAEQNLQLKWIWPIAAFLFSSMNPTKMGALKFIPIYEALVIRAQKSAPPYIAFEEVHQSEKNKSPVQTSVWAPVEAKAGVSLLAGGGHSETLAPHKIRAQKIVLNEWSSLKSPNF